MEHIDTVLDQAAQRKADGDPVRLAKQQLKPVREWAIKSEKEFHAEAAKLAPRIDKAMEQINRLEALLGVTLNQPRLLFAQVESCRNGIPTSYRLIVEQIDGLTDWHVGQPAYMTPLHTSQAHAPGNISHLVAALDRLERSLAKYAARFGEGNPTR